MTEIEIALYKIVMAVSLLVLVYVNVTYLPDGSKGQE